MADRKISDLTALTTPASGDYLPIVDISEASAANKNKRITIEELLRGAPDGTAGAPGFAFEIDPDSGLYRTGENGVALSTGGTGRLFITSAGLVGVGTSGPNVPLETAGANGTISIFRTNNATAANNAGGGFDAVASATASSRYAIMWLDADGANFAGSDYFYIQKNGNSGSVQIIQQSNAAMEFHTNGSHRARIDSSGRLLVGTSSDSGGALLQVNGNRIRVATAKTPSSASDTGTAGEICWDADYIYVCTATNTWKRTAISTWP